MRNKINQLSESVLDDLTTDDNVQKSSQVVADNTLASTGNRIKLEDYQDRWRYRLKITLYIMNYIVTDKEVEDEMRSILSVIFSSCRYVTDYEICLVEDPKVTNYVLRSHIDVLFNSRKTTFTRAMRTLFIPLMNLFYDHQNYRFAFIDLFDLQKPVEFDGGTFKYMYSVVNGDKSFHQDKTGQYYDWLKLYNIATRQIHRDDDNDQAFAGFYNLLLWTVFKMKWIQKFRTFKRDDEGYSIFDVNVSICDSINSGNITGTIRLLAKDLMTMATKMMILRVIAHDNSWFAISEKHESIIPLCENSLKHQRSNSIKPTKKLHDMILGETDNPPKLIINLFVNILHPLRTREERLFALQEFGSNKDFVFTF